VRSRDVSSGTTLYAKWTAATIKVTFQSNGGGIPSMADKVVTYGNGYGSLATISRSGYAFGGWYTEGFINLVTGGTTVTTSTSHNLYAKWQLNSYSITYNCNGGTPIAITTGVVYGSSYTTLSNTACTRVGF
jgi:uncharacterized repeat protein (TIGR02543 family)